MILRTRIVTFVLIFTILFGVSCTKLPETGPPATPVPDTCRMESYTPPLREGPTEPNTCIYETMTDGHNCTVTGVTVKGSDRENVESALIMRNNSAADSQGSGAINQVDTTTTDWQMRAPALNCGILGCGDGSYQVRVVHNQTVQCGPVELEIDFR